MKVLYMISGFNLFGGTPKKTLDLIKNSNNDCFLYVWSNGHLKNKKKFVDSGAKVILGFYGYNLFKHISTLLQLIDKEKIEIVQTQFTFGEILGGLIKVLRPKLKLIICFVGPFSPNGLKRIMVNFFYKKVDSFVFISKYVKIEKELTFSILKKKKSSIIYNGTEKLLDDGLNKIRLKGRSLLDVAGLVEWKNADILLKAMKIILKDPVNFDIHLYIIGDGSFRKSLEEKIVRYNIKDNVHLLGYQSNIGGFLNQCSVFVHPAYAEGFGIVIPEAMFESKPIIVSNAGALPELIENNITGLVIDPFDEISWSKAIINLLNDENLRKNLSKNAKKAALEKFSISQYVINYNNLYNSLLNED